MQYMFTYCKLHIKALETYFVQGTFGTGEYCTGGGGAQAE